MHRSLAALTLCVPLLGCSESDALYVGSQPSEVKERNWDEHPAVVVAEACDPLFALSDVHGGYNRMAKLLDVHGLADGIPPRSDAVAWAGGAACLVVSGDLINKHPGGLDTIEYLRTLQESAEQEGGMVVVLLGNHEVEFLNDPENSKATGDGGIALELWDEGVEPRDFARGADPRGKWLRNRPLAAKIGGWFFAHAGNTAGRTLDELDAALREAGQHNYEGPDGIGDDSIVEANDWWEGDDTIPARYAAAVEASHIVFGHDPDALGPRGEIALGYDAVLLRIDCGMSPAVDDSKGRLLRVWDDGGEEVAESLEPDGEVVELWRGAP